MRIGLSGHGKMGTIVEEIINERDDLRSTGSVAIGYYASFDELADGTEVIIDYSHPDRLDDLLGYATANGIPLVIATTGYTDEQEAQIAEAAKQIPIVFSGNYSLGINIMEKILKMITPILEDSFDMEIVEKHHNQKLDAPSGTAKMLVRAMDPEGKYEHVEGRSGMCKRGKEIGISAIRGGTITGEHIAIYAGDEEVLEIKHIANSRRIFALGSVKAAEFAVGAQPGLYTMDDVLF
ncbi:MAG: 4-hydroxy-tetrahydrodipicolinate reductase [Firmicutes bacterium]|nr:4-hydroxy-tetrahydrodipicolinate reductase [Bacillota bacterium]